jgi:hypothetical protein
MRSKHLREVPTDGTPKQEEEDYYLPPRKVVHPSENGKWTHIFYLTLLWLFILLVVGLTVWGMRYT